MAHPDPTLLGADQTPVEYRIKDKDLTMTFDGKASGARAVIGTDTFAGGPGYVHPEFVKANRIHTRPANAIVVLGDKHTTPCTEEGLVHVQMGSFSTKAWLLLLPIPEPFDILLGDGWLKAHKADLLYSKKCMEVMTPKRKFTVKARGVAKPISYTPQAPPEPEIRILNFMDIQQAAKDNTNEFHLLFVKPERDADTPEEEEEPEESVVPPHLKAELEKTLEEYADIFGSKLQQTAPVRENMPEVIPIIPGSKPVNRPLYRYSPAEVKEIEAQVKAMLEQNLIEHSTSPYGAPVLLVKKPDGSWRFCVDYRGLNAITVKNSHAIPRIDDLLDSIQGAKLFSSMDLLQGFYQLPLQESDKAKTAFKTCFGHFQFRVVSMGLSNAPSVFQRVMNQIFQKQLNKSVLIY